MQVNLKLQKNELRERYKQIRRELDPDDKQRMDKKIATRVSGLWAFRDSELILAYIAKSIEVETADIITAAWQLGKKVAVPRCREGTREMDFYVLSSFDKLVAGTYGLMEPDPEKCERLENFDNAMCIVPAISFDTNGYRLGFGKGYYDRFLSGFDGRTVGLCYTNCIDRELPHGKYDRRVHMLVTERKLLTFDNTEKEVRQWTN